MGQQSETRYNDRTVDEWVKRARDGRAAVADFQRSFVWPPKKAGRYINAILRGRPVGFYLILDASPSPQFSPRGFSNMETPLDKVEELVLDGQQRLTSLLHALYGHPSSRFFIEVEDLAAETLELKRVVAYGNSNPEAKRLAEPVEAYRSNHIPIDVLRRPEGSGARPDPLTKWCSDVGPKVAGFENYAEFAVFQNRIVRFAEERFFQRRLYTCWLPKDTTRAEATEIFVETNTSSVQIKKFDEHVAKVRGTENQDFRKMIGEARRESEVLRYFFPGDEEKAIPAIGTWLLKLGCLHTGAPPKESRYEEGAQHLFERNGSTGEGVPKKLRHVLDDIDWALKRVSDMGSPSQATLPSWPPVHVLATIRSQYQGIEDPEEANAARLLIDAYYWRSLFTNRHEQQANDNLHKDLKELVDVLDGKTSKANSMRIFSDRHHPLFNDSWLAQNAGWIGRSKTGKAVVAAVLASEPRPVDWITGEPLGATHVRQLERAGNLDRHHVFPKDILLAEKVPQGEIHNGLNGVLLEKRTNGRFWKYPPAEYVENVTEKKKVEEAELRGRISGHFVPFEEMVSTKGAMGDRYRRFLAQRAKLLAERIEQLAKPPD